MFQQSHFFYIFPITLGSDVPARSTLLFSRVCFRVLWYQPKRLIMPHSWIILPFLPQETIQVPNQVSAPLCETSARRPASESAAPSSAPTTASVTAPATNAASTDASGNTCASLPRTTPAGRSPFPSRDVWSGWTSCHLYDVTVIA